MQQIPFRISSFESNAMKSKNPVSGYNEADISPTLDTTQPTPAKAQGGLAIVSPEPSFAIAENVIGRRDDTGGNGPGFLQEKCYTLNATGVHGVATEYKVRRLTPEECERLQGFPTGYTRIPWKGKPESQCPDAPRYKAIGNSWAVPVVQWIGKRIQQQFDARKKSCQH